MRLHLTWERRGEDVSVPRQPLYPPIPTLPLIRMAVAILGLFAITASAEDPWLLWAKSVHDISSYNYFVTAMAADRQGNVCLSGSVNSDQGYTSLWFGIYNRDGMESFFGHPPSGQFGADSMSAADLSVDGN